MNTIFYTLSLERLSKSEYETLMMFLRHNSLWTLSPIGLPWNKIPSMLTNESLWQGNLYLASSQFYWGSSKKKQRQLDLDQG